MSASPAPGDRPPLQGLRRSFTTPTRQLSVHEKAGLDKTDANADVLYTHPSARILSFSPPTDSIRSSSKAEIPPDTDYPIDTVETLPWRSRTETLAASGILKIEKVRGSTNFLKCQDVMHAILRNSQCWCVDGESKFVLRVRQFKYYRIELPSTTIEDKAKVEELKRVLPTVLRFERTPCPFIRAFTVDLPDDAITPRRKGQWKRRDSSQPNISDSETPPTSRGKATRSWSMKSPPTSYPKNGPGYTSNFERGRPGSSAGAYRRDLSFDNYRNSSPASYAPSEDGSDSEHQESEHGSEKESVTDRSDTASPQIEHIGTHVQVCTPMANEKTRPSGSVLRHESSTDDSDEGLDSREPVKGADEAVAQDDRPEVVVDNVDEDDDRLPDEVMLDGANGLPVSSNDGKELISQEVEGVDSDINVDQDTAMLKNTETVPLATYMEDKQSVLSEDLSENSSADDTGESLQAEQPETFADTKIMTEEIGLDVEKPVQKHIPDDGKPTKNADLSSAHEIAETPIVQMHHVGVSPVAHESKSANDRTLEQNVRDGSASEVGSVSKEGITQAKSAGDIVSGRMEHEQIAKDELRRNFSVDQDQSLQPAPNLSADNLIFSKDLTETPSYVEDAAEEQDDNDDTLSAVSSVDSFHTMASIIHGSPRSPRKSNLNLDRDIRHKRELSEMTVTASSMDEFPSPEYDMASTSRQDPLHNASLLCSSEVDGPEPATPTSSGQPPDGLRQRLKSRRSFSPLPPPSTIFTGNQIRHDSGNGHMTKAILQKVIVKPIEVVVLVVHILARIAGGATVNDLLSGELFKRPEHRRSVSGFADQLIDGRLNDSDTDDDFGVPIRGRRRSKSRERRLAMVFDEVDEDAVEDVD